MTRRIPTNVAASVRQRLYNLAKEKDQDFNFVLARFVAERLLFRLSVSESASDFVLKGALLFLLWSDHLYRPTRDVDLLGYGENSIGKLEDTFRKVGRIQAVEDGLVFDADSVQGANIREDQEYDGVRITLTAFLGNARIPMQIDIGFGDAIKVVSSRARRRYGRAHVFGMPMMPVTAPGASHIGNFVVRHQTGLCGE